MARVPVALIRRGIDTGTAPSKYESTQNQLFDMRRRLHLRLRDMTEDDLRKVSMCTFDSMMMQLWREGHIWTGRMLTEFVELDKIARKICMLVAPELRRASLKTEKKLLRHLADELCSAEDAMNIGNKAVQCRHLLNLAEETASRGVSWWWLTERLLEEATAAVSGAKDDGEIAAKIAFATGVFLLDQLHESGEAVESLTKAMRLSQNKEWLATTRLMMAYKPPSLDVSVYSIPIVKTVEEVDEPKVTPPLDSGSDTDPVTLFRCASAALCRALLQESRRARIGCPFGVLPGRKPPPRSTQATNPSTIKFKGNLFQDQVRDVELRPARFLTERKVSVPNKAEGMCVSVASFCLEISAKEEKIREGDKRDCEAANNTNVHAKKATSTVKRARLDFNAILKDDIGEPEVQDPSKVDSESAASFCREAAQHARNAGRRDLEESALLELGISLQTGQKFAEALQPMQTALTMYTEEGDSGQEIKTYFQIALCYQKMEKYKEAQEELQKALLRAQETGNQSLIYTAHKYLGTFFLNTNQRQYATTHLALALLQAKNLQGSYQRRLIRVLTGLAGANELMPEFISLLRSTESPGQEGWSNMLKLLQWRENRTVFWSDAKTSRVVQTLEMRLPPRETSEESSGKLKKRGGESSDEREAGDTQTTDARASQSDENKTATSEMETDTLADVRTEAEDEFPEPDS